VRERGSAGGMADHPDPVLAMRLIDQQRGGGRG
jgi:hypothetical protein